MGQETPDILQPDCPYPAFQEISTRQIERGTILGLGTLINYLYYVITKESSAPNTSELKPSLVNACTTVIKLLTRSFPLSNVLSHQQVYRLDEAQYLQSDLLLDFADPSLPKKRFSKL